MEITGRFPSFLQKKKKVNEPIMVLKIPSVSNDMFCFVFPLDSIIVVSHIPHTKSNTGNIPISKTSKHPQSLK